MMPASTPTAPETAEQLKKAHTCRWPGCRRTVPAEKWGCKEHWNLLPDKIRHPIWTTVRPGQFVSGPPSADHLEALAAADAWVTAYIERKRRAELPL